MLELMAHVKGYDPVQTESGCLVTFGHGFGHGSGTVLVPIAGVS